MLGIVLVVTVALALLARRHAQRNAAHDLRGRTREEQQAMLEADQRARRERGGGAGDGRLGDRF